jgi:hypothetical protein
MRAQVAVGESGRVQLEDEQSGEQRVGAGIAETQAATRLVPMVIGVVRAVNAVAPPVESWLMDWTCNRRRLAVKPTSRSAGRFISRFPMRKSPGLLMVVSVRNHRRCQIVCVQDQ